VCGPVFVRKEKKRQTFMDVQPYTADLTSITVMNLEARMRQHPTRRKLKIYSKNTVSCEG
jgi:hypothetical protein